MSKWDHHAGDLGDAVEYGLVEHPNLPDQARQPGAVAQDLLARLDELTLETSGSWMLRRGSD